MCIYIYILHNYLQLFSVFFFQGSGLQLGVLFQLYFVGHPPSVEIDRLEI